MALTQPELAMQDEGKTLCAFCNQCTKERLATTDGLDKTGKIIYKRGDFIVDCRGIPANDRYIPRQTELLKQLNIPDDPSNEEYQEIISLYDKVLWAKKYLNWEPRESVGGEPYQANILRCSAKRKVLRCGRRIGKTEVLIADALYKLFNYSPKEKRYDPHTKKMVKGFSTILFVAPYLSQVKDFFTRLRDAIGSNPELKQEIDSDVSTPFFRLELKSGMKILGFSAGSSGASSLRGQKADFIILDEMDYLDQESIDTIVALLMEHNDVEIIASSTPSGQRNYFYQFCKERMDFKEFYYPSMCNPNWGPRMEMELRGLYRTEIAWKHEIEAEFGEASTSVFQYQHIENALRSYYYRNLTRSDGCFYAMGVDWNDAENGTKIRIVQYNQLTGMVTAVDHATIQKAGWTQTAAIEEIIRLNRLWKCDHIYVDAGYGATQIEMLKQLGQQAQFRRDQYAHADMTLMKVRGVNFSSKIETFDPITGMPTKQMMKPYLVESAVRFFERQMIEIPMEDELLIKQLHGYQIVRVNSSGVPVYEAGPSGDHDLDALMLALMAIEVEYGAYTKQHFTSTIAISGRLGEGTTQPGLINVEEDFSPAAMASRAQMARAPEKRDIGTTVSSLGSLFGIQKPSRIYTRDAFNNDDRRPVAGRQSFMNHHPSFRGSRSIH